MQWLFALGYLLCYAPYAYLIHRSATVGHLPALSALPVSILSCHLTLCVFLLFTGWWRLIRWGPGIASGAATSVILLASTLAYSLPTVSVLLMVTLMKGGVLVMAPLIDASQGRRVSVGSRVALALAAAALFTAAGCSVAVPGTGVRLPAEAVGVVAAYLGGYLVKLRLLGPRKRESDEERLSFFVTESAATVSTALVLVTVAGWFLPSSVIPAPLAHQIASGWGEIGRADLWLAGALSQGTGLFGGLILLGRQTHSHCVTFNRAAGVLAGVTATLLGWLSGGRAPSAGEWVGACLIICAVAALSRGKQ